MVSVEKIVNQPVPSCCYIIYDTGSLARGCIIVDPATEKPQEILSFINDHNLNPSYIILTHEHFDHCRSVDQLRDAYPAARLVCSSLSNAAIQDEKKNCSVFWDYEKRFTIAPADILIEDLGNRLDWNGETIEFIPTPGHTPGSFSFRIGRYLFTGDAYIPGIRTVTKLPGGNKQQAAESEARIKALVADGGMIVCPGH